MDRQQSQSVESNNQINFNGRMVCRKKKFLKNICKIIFNGFVKFNFNDYEKIKFNDFMKFNFKTF